MVAGEVEGIVVGGEVGETTHTGVENKPSLPQDAYPEPIKPTLHVTKIGGEVYTPRMDSGSE